MKILSLGDKLLTSQMPFEVHPSVIFKLGQELITDDYQALIELIKNAYDADASKVFVRVHTDKLFALKGNTIEEVFAEEKSALRGVLDIGDDGSGMSIDEMREGWLTISSSHKKLMKERGETTPKNRTPLGDKGLGRLGVQRLGSVLEMETKRLNSEALRTIIDWRRFESNRVLSQIQLAVEAVQSSLVGDKGTRLRIFGLNNITMWKNSKELQNRFAEILSPYSEWQGLNVALYVDDRAIDLRELSKIALRNSDLTYYQTYTNEVLSTQGEMSLNYLEDLRNNAKRERWNRAVKRDDGLSFLRWMDKNHAEKMQLFNVEAASGNKFCRYSFNVFIKDVKDVEENNGICNPGDFEGRIDYISRDAVKSMLGASSVKEYMDSVKGIRIYRDGFGIKLKKDLYELAAQWTSASSYYTLNPNNTVGYMNLSAKNNPDLKETTNREEFIDNEFFRNLQRLLAEWLQKTEQVQSLLRRGYLEYCKEMFASEAEVEATIKPSKLAKKVNSQIDGFVKTAELALSKEGQWEKQEEASNRVKSSVNLLAERLGQAEDWLQVSYELTGLGILAEMLSHEIKNIADRLDTSARTMEKYNKEKYGDITISRFADTVSASSRGLKKQVAHLDSSLQYIRDVKKTELVSALVNECVDFFAARLQNRNIYIALQIENDFSVRVNKGKIIQVFDNLFYNSEYWLNRNMDEGAIESGAINIVVNGPRLLFYDNGIGINKGVEAIIFDPFVTDKPRNAGRGLGLFICRELLASEDCAIDLAPERNEYGNRYKFIIDLCNAME